VGDFGWPSGPLSCTPIVYVKDLYEYLIFKLSDIDLFEKGHSISDKENHQLNEEVKAELRPSQKHRVRCRAIAELIWKSKPDTTIADMAINNEITGIACEGKLYGENTIRDWIKDLCPNRAPGRRPKPQ
jgi:hypothetical protein